MLTDSCFSNEPFLTQSLGEQGLGNDIVDLVGPRVVKVLPHEVYVGPSPARSLVVLRKPDSNSERAYISVSGTYYPPNLLNRPNALGSYHVAGSIGTTGSLTMVQRMGVDLAGLTINFFNLKGDCEEVDVAKGLCDFAPGV